MIETGQSPEADVVAIRPLGTPVVLACHNGSLQWWKQTTGIPVLQEKIDSAQLQRFFAEHQDDLGPKTVFEGKTFRRLPHQTQLSFVDAGLLPFVEREQGAQLSGLVVRALRDIEETLARKIERDSDIDNAIKATFWLLAAKALRDKGVNGFKTADLADVDDVFMLFRSEIGQAFDGKDFKSLVSERRTEMAARATIVPPPIFLNSITSSVIRPSSAST
ncbi:MAG: hypothetical protein IIA64_04305 [Planctomycetes bacterium]|nr:hypothetical protein [Planctomycetota bacterium]